MNQQHSYLIFRINNSLYGVSTYSVKEIFLLPELTPIPEASPGIVGAIDVRGHILPVMDLNLRFGRGGDRYPLTDRVIVLEQGERELGIIVNQVSEVRNIPEAAPSDRLQYGQQSTDSTNPFIASVVRSQDDIVVIIDLANLLQYPSQPNYLNPQPLGSLANSDRALSLEQGVGDRLSLDSSPPNYQTQLTSEALAILKERADLLKQIDEVWQNSRNLKNLAIVVLNNELFGVDLENIREFTSIEQVVPVPCCPSHIIGNMNLRGEILTLVDICQLLNLPPINLSKVSQLVVVEVEQFRVGIAIQKVRDTIAVNAKKIDAVPAANYSERREYYKGTLPYQDKIISILDIAKMLRDDNLTVDSP